MFRKLRLILASLMIVGFACVAGAGGDDDWSIVKAAGQIWLRAGGASTIALGDTKTIAPGTTLATGASGRVHLQRGAETMVVGPNSLMQLPYDASRSFTTVIEAVGEIEFDVERRNVRHFSVETPYLAAVVKGTHFVVSAGPSGDAVVVRRGVVQVTALRSGETVDVLAGQKVEVSETGLAVSDANDRADAGPGAGALTQGSGVASAGAAGGGGVSVGAGGSNGVNASIGGGGGVSASVGGSNGVNVSVGGGDGIGVEVGGGTGVSVNIGGGSGVGVQVGGIGVGLGGP